MLKELRIATLSLLVMTVLTGVLYPVATTVLAQLLYPRQAGGDPSLIGQPFAGPAYFWSRPSATSPYPYNAASSGGSNQGPLNPPLGEAVASRVKALRDADPGNAAPVPADLVTASASGLDPHISPAAAEYQVSRVARARGVDPARVRELVAEHVERRQFAVLGEPRVNVVALNSALDRSPARRWP